MRCLKIEERLFLDPETPVPEALFNEALIAMQLAGICATDLELLRGYADFQGIPGHEFVGRVVSVGNSAHHDWINRRVIGSINVSCGSCDFCKQNQSDHCLNRDVLGIRNKPGVFAEYFTLPVSNLLEVSDSVTDREAVFAEPLAAAIQVSRQLQSYSVKQVAVLGPGKLGLLIAMVLAYEGYDVQMIGRNELSLSLPRKLGFKINQVEAMDANSVGCVVDATGNPAGFNQAVHMLKPKGILILKSTYANYGAIDLSQVVINELSVLGSRCGPIKEALKLLTTKAFDLTSLIDGEYDLTTGLQAFDHASRSGTRKILLAP